MKLLNDGIAPQSIFDGLFTGAGEMLMQAPGIVSLHAMTFTNAVHYAWHRVRSDETRRLLLLQNAAFLPLYRGNRADSGVHIDTLEPLAPEAAPEGAVAEIFADVGRDRLAAARKMLAYLKDQPSAQPLADAARRLIFLKGTNAHDYKFSSAVLEDYERLSPPGAIACSPRASSTSAAPPTRITTSCSAPAQPSARRGIAPSAFRRWTHYRSRISICPFPKAERLGKLDGRLPTLGMIRGELDPRPLRGEHQGLRNVQMTQHIQVSGAVAVRGG